MVRFIVRRLLWMIPVLFAVTLITFLLMHAAPGGPWDRDPGRRQIDAATQARLDHEFGLDKPMWRQYVAYILGDVDDEGQLALVNHPADKFPCFCMGSQAGSDRKALHVRQQLDDGLEGTPPKNR